MRGCPARGYNYRSQNQSVTRITSVERFLTGQPMSGGKNRIMIFGPKDDGTYVVEFRTAAGEALVISIPRTECAVIQHFQERMPYGLFVPDVP
jgi:hypothetical protein